LTKQDKVEQARSFLAVEPEASVRALAKELKVSPQAAAWIFWHLGMDNVDREAKDSLVNRILQLVQRRPGLHLDEIRTHAKVSADAAWEFGGEIVNITWHLPEGPRFGTTATWSVPIGDPQVVSVTVSTSLNRTATRSMVVDALARVTNPPQPTAVTSSPDSTAIEPSDVSRPFGGGPYWLIGAVLVVALWHRSRLQA